MAAGGCASLVTPPFGPEGVVGPGPAEHTLDPGPELRPPRCGPIKAAPMRVTGGCGDLSSAGFWVR